MIRNRTFMMGLGAGLVLGALLFQLMLIGERSMNPSPQTLSKEEVVKAAESLNLKVVEDSEKLMTKEQWEESIKDGKGEKQEAEDPKAPSAPDTGAQPSQPVKPNAPKETKEPAGTPEARAPEKPGKPAPAQIPHNIKRGTLADVAEGLERAGIIESREALIKAASARGINRIVQQGTFYFTPGESLDSIIGKISSKPPQ